MNDDDLKRYFTWIDGLSWRLLTWVLALWALALGSVLLWHWLHC